MLEDFLKKTKQENIIMTESKSVHSSILLEKYSEKYLITEIYTRHKYAKTFVLKILVNY